MKTPEQASTSKVVSSDEPTTAVLAHVAKIS